MKTPCFLGFLAEEEDDVILVVRGVEVFPTLVAHFIKGRLNSFFCATAGQANRYRFVGIAIGCHGYSSVFLTASATAVAKEPTLARFAGAKILVAVPSATLPRAS